MSRVLAFLRSLGADGAARNARILLDDRRRERLAVDALTASIERPPASPDVGAAA